MDVIAAEKFSTKLLRVEAHAMIIDYVAKNEKALNQHYEKTISAAENIIRTTGTAYDSLVNRIRAQTTKNCGPLIELVTAEKEFSGTTINYCIRRNKPNNITLKSDFNAAVTDSQKIIDNFQQVIVTTLSERNAMTEPKQIREQIKALLDAEKENIRKTVEALKENLIIDTSAYKEQLDALQYCMRSVQRCVDSSIKDKESQAVTCPEIKSEDEFGMAKSEGQGCFDKVMREL